MVTRDLQGDYAALEPTALPHGSLAFARAGSGPWDPRALSPLPRTPRRVRVFPLPFSVVVVYLFFVLLDSRGCSQSSPIC